jgi:type I restriction enzyme S subunit
MADISVVKLSELEGAKRIDAEYYEHEYLETKNKLINLQTKTIQQISESVLSFGAYSLCNYIVWRESGIPYLKAENVHGGYIDFSETMFIDEDVNNILHKSQVKEEQVLVSMSGTTGNVAVAYKVAPKLNSNQDIAKITLKRGYSPYSVAAFLNSKYGQLQIEREIVGSVQQHVFLGQIKQFRVPILLEKNENEVEKIYKQGLDKLELSKSLYSQAENLLLEELRLKEFKPKYELSYTANLSKALGVHRVDAEYFQPAYHQLVEYLKNNFETRPLKTFIVDFQKGIEVGSENYQEEGKPFIRVSNLSIHGFVERDQKYIDEGLYQTLKDTYGPKVGDFLLTKDATPGIAHVVKEPVEGIIASGILKLKINEDEIDKEYLALCINFMVGRLQIERDGGGSVITHWRPEQIKNLLIPILPPETQQKIASLVQQSHEARKKAKELLEEAKRKVEKEIEK